MGFLKPIVLGVVAGVAANYFLTTKEGQEAKKRILRTIDDYQANPEEYHDALKAKAVLYRDVTLNTLHDYKAKVESGELTTDDVLGLVKDKTMDVAHLAGDVLTRLTKTAQVPDVVGADLSEMPTVTPLVAEVDDIVIDLSSEDV